MIFVSNRRRPLCFDPSAFILHPFKGFPCCSSSPLHLVKRALALAVGALLLMLGGMRVHAAPARVDHTDESIAALHDHHFLEEPEYWLQNATETGRCDGAKVAKMLVDVAGVFKGATTTEEAIDVLTKHGVIGVPEAWRKGAVAGGSMSGANVATVLNRCAAHLPVEPPKSANAAPLEASPPSKLRSSYDVIIAGAGTGGVGAAVQAARMGRSVLLLEETDWIGGQMNAAAVTSMDEGVDAGARTRAVPRTVRAHRRALSAARHQLHDGLLEHPRVRGAERGQAPAARVARRCARPGRARSRLAHARHEGAAQRRHGHGRRDRERDRCGHAKRTPSRARCWSTPPSGAM